MFQTRHGKRSSKRYGLASLALEHELLLSILLSGLPGVVLSCILLWNSSYSFIHKTEITALLVLLWTTMSISTRRNVIDSLHVLSNVISSMEEEDFSVRAALTSRRGALGELARNINSLAQALEVERLGTLEAESLLRKVLFEVDTAIFAFSPDGRLRLLNRAAVSFLGKDEKSALNLTAQELGVADLLRGPLSETIYRSRQHDDKRWIVRRAHFRQQGVRHDLVVLSEASEILRAEERLAWQRIIRVLGHEINNSLAPIRSLTRTLLRMASATQLPANFRENLNQGMEVIGGRAESLNRFLQGYALLAKLPAPTPHMFILHTLVERVTALESRIAIKVIPGPKIRIHADSDQLQQALINILRNAVDAVLLKSQQVAPESVTMSWQSQAADLIISVRDCGVGLADTENLFVPFYTTKENGSGIGLLLSRQIVEGHRGTLSIRNRSDAPGCEVELRLPQCVVSGGERA
jgi:two-component system nitrogen regulation sensor histidine kinase NtrY